MLSSSFLSEFQRVLPPETAQLVFRTLRRDSLLWSSLQEETFFKKVAAQAGDGPASWSPAGLALLAMDQPHTPEELANVEMPALDRNLRQHALHVYEEVRREGKAPATLKQAGLAACALRERRRLTRSWQGMIAEMMVGPEASPAVLFAAWRTPVTCLYAMVPDPAEMVASLVSNDPAWPSFDLIAHVLLTNQVKPADLKEQFARALGLVSLDMQLDWLRRLQRLGEGQLVTALAAALLQSQSSEHAVSWTQNDKPAASLAKAHGLAQLAGLHRFAHQNEQAYALIEKAKEATQRWMVGLNTQLTEIAIADGKHTAEPALMEELIGAVENSALLQTDLTLTLGKYAQAKSLVEQATEPAHPFAQILKAAVVAASGDRELAQQMARKAVMRFIKELGGESAQELSELIFDWQPERLVQILFDLDLLAEARNLAQALLPGRPTDLSLIGWLSLLFQKLGSLVEAIDAARTALILEPFDADRHRRMADLWEVDEDWDRSFEERTRILDLTGSDQLEDRLAYIQSALRSKHFDQAAAACDEILAEDPNHGMATAYLGWTKLEMGEQKEAINILSKATLLIPEEAQPWLMLAEAYRKEDQHKRALETLRAGVLSAPESPEINFSLANACLESGSLSEALPFLKKAASLTPNNLEVTLGLGNTLFCLGHLADARQVLGTARQKWVSNPDLAFAYAQVLIAAGEPEKAVPVFEVALQKDPPQFAWYLLYAETLLDDWEALISGQKKVDFAHLVNAQQALEKALLLNPEDFQAHLLLAETLSAKGRPDAAIEIYQRLVETADSEAPAYCWRVQGGFGKVALQLGQVETALVALQEASCGESSSVFFQRLLAEAYLEADLKKEALQVARNSQRLAPNDLDTLSWFAEMALKMGEALEAVEALETATQLAPDDPDYMTRLAGLHMQIGNLDAARKAYETMTGLDLVQPDHLQQAAYGYLRMEDRPSALGCLQRAVEMSPVPSADLLFETARLLLETDQPEAALDCLQKAIQSTPLDLKYHMFQSDLLVILNRPQAAQACLEHALQLKEAQDAVDLAAGDQQPVQDKPWMEALDDLTGIHARFASLLRKLGDLGPALYHAEKALERCPDDVTLRLIGASLALAQMKWTRAEELAAADWQDLEHSVPAARRESARLAWLGLKVELALRNGLDKQAETWLEEVSFAPEKPRLMAARVCLAARKGEWQVAIDLFDRAMALLNHTGKNQPVRWISGTTFDPGIVSPVEEILMLADAAVEAHRWEDAQILSERAAAEYPQEPRCYFEYARKVVLLAERKRLCLDLSVKANAPGDTVLSPETFANFETILNQVEPLNGSPEVVRWSTRGRAIFHPTYINARALMAVAKSAEETAALASVLRQLGNYPVAIQVAGSAAITRSR
jgi:tetratricopeptide (TPR) repeat protein